MARRRKKATKAGNEAAGCLILLLIVGVPLLIIVPPLGIVFLFVGFIVWLGAFSIQGRVSCGLNYPLQALFFNACHRFALYKHRKSNISSAVLSFQYTLAPFNRKLTTRRIVLSITPLPIGNLSGNLFFELFFGFACLLFDLLHLNFFGNFEREQFVGVPFDAVLEITERLIRSHFEVVEFSCCFVELSPNGGEMGVGLIG